MKQPGVTLIVPVYRTEEYLRKCLKSLTDQTYTDLEIILVEDGSPDNCGTICDEYAGKDSRIRVIHQSNGGVSSARNAGLAAAAGAWIGFVDSDDCVEPDQVEYLLRLAERYGADIVQCGIFFEENGRAVELFRTENDRFLPYGAQRFTGRDWQRIGNSVCNKLYRAEMIRELRFEPAYPVGEDLLFNVCALMRASGVVIGAESKYHYIQRGDSACHEPPALGTLKSYRRVLEKVMELLGTESAARAYFEKEQFRNDLDICSKIVRFARPEFEAVREEIRSELRRKTASIFLMKGLSAAERAKLLLAAWFWRVYRSLLLMSKKRR